MSPGLARRAPGATRFQRASADWLGRAISPNVVPSAAMLIYTYRIVYGRRTMMGWSFFALAVALLLAAFGLVMDHNGRKADRERAGLGRRDDGD